MVVVEGMACGKAVIVSQAGGAAELFEEGKTALGHPPGDSTRLAEAMRRLIAEPELRQRLGEAGRQYVAATFSRQALAQQLTEVYRRIAGARQA